MKVTRSIRHLRGCMVGMLVFALCATLHAQTITRAEYFYDTDPGCGNGTAITFTAGDPVTFTSTISTTGLSPGHHWLFVRTRSSDGFWSLYELQEFVIEGGVLAAEYFVDSDPGLGNGTPITVPANTGSFTGIIPTTTIPDGEHFLFIRTRHDDNSWSLSDPQPFIIATRITEAEYFIDTDPGFGNGNPITITSPSDLVTINTAVTIPALPNGDHYLFIRTRDIHGQWSHYEQHLFTVDSTLPIELLDFDGKLMESNEVQLKWSTATEINNDYFTVEHATGPGAFIEVLRLPGAGNSLSQKFYSAIHSQPFPGTNYYRLRQTDFDGRFSYSEVISVNVVLPDRTMVYPNPVTDHWVVRFGEGTVAVSLELFDLSGKRLQNINAEGLRQVDLNRNGIADGMYIVRVMTAERVEMIKVEFR